MADGVGFEPTETRASAVFKTATINHSDTHPQIQNRGFRSLHNKLWYKTGTY
jgi:hypothetical protein